MSLKRGIPNKFKIFGLITIFVVLSTFILNSKFISITYNESDLYEINKPKRTCDNYCYSIIDDFRRNRYFGAKSAYQRVNQYQLLDHVTVPDCRPVKMWSLFRHGSRLPGRTEITKLLDLGRVRDAIVYNYKENNGYILSDCRLCAADINALKNWNAEKFNLPDDAYLMLAEQGWLDLSYLAKSFQNMFPGLFDSEYSPETYLFHYSREKRTTQSFQAFVDGLFGKEIQIPPNPSEDMLLMPYYQCPLSVNNSRFIKVEGSQIHILTYSQQFQQMVRRVLQRLGLRDARSFRTLWNVCQLEQSWDMENLSPWCAAFSPSDLKLLDYEEDMMYYYMKSYGHDINKYLDCYTVADMMEHLNSDQKQPKVIAYFVHSTLLYTFLTALDIAKDNEPLLADNFDRMTNRKFKSSEIIPFSANFAAIKYKCDGNVSSSTADQYKIMFLLNQKPINVEWCQPNGFCNLADVQKALSKFNKNNCPNLFCKPDRNSASIAQISNLILLISVLSYCLF